MIQAIQDRLQNTIWSLGSTPAEVAATISAAGVSGRPRSLCHCPVANYVRQQVEAAESDLVSVSPAHVYHHVAGTSGTYGVSNSPAVAAFIKAFDEGAYQDLLPNFSGSETPNE